MNHTKEPWIIAFEEPRQITISSNDELNKNIVHIRFADGNGSYAELTSEDKANAARIVACVNACAGIPTEDMNAYTDKGITLSDAIATFKSQRDKLFNELKICNESLQFKD